MKAGLIAARAGMRARRIQLRRRLAAEVAQGKSRVVGVLALALGIALVIGAACFGLGHWIAKSAPEIVRTPVSFGLLGLSTALVLSALGHAAQCFFSAKDLWFWDSTPAPAWARFVDRFTETAVAAAPATFALGIVAVVGYVGGAGLGVLAIGRGVVAVALTTAIPLSIGVILAHAGGALLPAGQLRRISLVVLGLAVCGALVWFRRARFEKVLTPEGAAELLNKAREVKGVGPSALPSELGARFVADGDTVAFFGLLAWVAAIVTLAFLAHRVLSRRARDLAVDESPVGLIRGSGRERVLRFLLRAVTKDLRPVVEKDLLAFFRDPAQWGQVVLLLGVGAIYLVNASLLRDGLMQLQNIGSVFLPAVHTGLITFIAAGLAARFAFPQVGLEGPAVWIVDGSPLHPRKLMNAKVYAGLPVVVIFPALVALVGGFVIDLPKGVWLLTSAECALVSLGVCAFGVGRGALKPLFDAASLSELAIGPGALSTMLTSVILAGFGSFGALVAGGCALASELDAAPAIVMWPVAIVAVAVPALTAILLGRRSLERGAFAFVRRREDEATRQFFALDRTLLADE